jgi:thiol:disulfide interchange protein DsbG
MRSATSRVRNLAVAAILGFSFAAHAADELTNIPPPIQLAVQGGLKIEKKFEAEGGMTGWLLTQGPGQNLVVFSTPDGKVAISGAMVDGSGKNLTNQYIEKYAPKTDYSKFWPQLEKSSYVAESPVGKPKSVIYVFKDANCGYCHLAWKALQPYVAAGVEVRWIMVAFLKEDSFDKAAAVMEAKDKKQAMQELHASFGKPAEKLKAPSAATRAKIDANNTLMAQMGFRGTPGTVYKTAKGEVKVLDGMPKLTQLPEVTGVPFQKNDDPALARFAN